FLEINWEGEDTRHTEGKANICYSDRVYVTLSGYVNEDGWPYEVDADILHYTGLKDVAGREIYEGDIVSFYNDGEYKLKSTNALVIYDSGAFMLEHKKLGKEYLGEIDIEGMCVKVIGNIYENSELLEGEWNEQMCYCEKKVYTKED
ncbi:YopX family protein, partial [Clostridium perfringens]